MSAHSYLQQKSSGETELGHDAKDDSTKSHGIRRKATWATEVGNELHLLQEDVGLKYKQPCGISWNVVEGNGERKIVQIQILFFEV